VNDARNVRRPPKASYAMIRGWRTITTMTMRCSIPPIIFADQDGKLDG
jgi:hypothetical protein